MEDQPITPHAGPTVNDDGKLTYIGDDGRRYVVGLPVDIDEASIKRVMGMLRGSQLLFQQMESLAHRWISEVAGPDLESRQALVLLITTLETALQAAYPEREDDPIS